MHASHPVLGHLRAVLTGPARPFTRAGTASAIHKSCRAGPVWAGPAGLHADEQGDLRMHGGPDKAVHVYPWPHYPAWRRDLAAHALAMERLQAPGAFGENFSLAAAPGLDEQTVCLGDQWAIGAEARFEVSQGRQPCWKLNDRFGIPDMAARMQHSGRTGWYLRVLVPGRVQAGDAVRLVARPCPAWPLARLLGLIASRHTGADALREALALPLPPSWQRLFARRLASGAVEGWEARMDGPAPA